MCEVKIVLFNNVLKTWVENRLQETEPFQSIQDVFPLYIIRCKIQIDIKGSTRCTGK